MSTTQVRKLYVLKHTTGKKTRIDISFTIDTDRRELHTRLLNIVSHQRNANQNHEPLRTAK
jgi:hypothetical protein